MLPRTSRWLTLIPLSYLENMRGNDGGLEPSQLETRLEAYDAPPSRMGHALLIALSLHAGFLLYTYIFPMPPPPRKLGPIEMEVRAKKPPRPTPTTPRSEVKPPPATTPQQPTASRPATSRTMSRPIELAPRKAGPSDPGSSAVELPPQPPGEPSAPGAPTGRIELFPTNLNKVVDPTWRADAIRTRPDTLIHDPLKDPKKEPPFELVPDKGGYKCSTKTMVAHIFPDGKITFDNRNIGFEKGSPGAVIDFGDIITRRKGIDPYYAEKRKILAFTAELRQKLRDQATRDYAQQAMETFTSQLATIWSSARSAAARRRALYEKWADCDEDTEDLLARKGRHAVEDFVRGHLPRGSGNAYTEEELTRIAQSRKGLAPFDPYGTGTP